VVFFARNSVRSVSLRRARHFRAALLGTTALIGAGCALVAPAQAQSGPFLYVPENTNGRVSVIDTSTNLVVTETALVGSGTFLAAVRGDESVVYVGSVGAVTPIDAATNTVGAPVPLRGAPLGEVMTPDGRTVYVTALFGFINATATVVPINTATNTAGTPIPVQADASALAMTPDGRTVYVANVFSTTLTPINTATNTAGAPIPIGIRPFAMAVTPDGRTLYVTSQSNTVIPINTATNLAGSCLRGRPMAFLNFAGSRSSARRKSGYCQRQTNGSTGLKLRSVASTTKASFCSWVVKFSIESGSRAKTPLPDMRSMASFPAWFPLL